jgi:hypothetical protein
MDTFSIRSLFGAVKPLAFPPYLLYSDNYYRPAWSLRGFRRLKNTCVVMEWVPSPGAVTEGTDAVSVHLAQLTAEREADLRAAFDMFDADGSGLLGADETLEMLKALDVEIGTEGELAEYVKVTKHCLYPPHSFHIGVWGIF